MIYFVLFLSLFLAMLSYFRYRQVLNPFTLEIYYTIFFLLLPQICKIIWFGEESYFWSDVVILVSILSIYCGTLFSMRVFKLAPIENVKISSFTLCCLALFLFIFTLPILLQCGISFLGIRCYYETVVFSKYASFYDIAKKFIEVAVILLLVKYCKFRWFVILLLLLLVFSGNKFAILSITVLIVLFLEEYYKVSTKRIVLFGGGTFIFLLVFHFFTSISPLGSIWINALSYFDIYNTQSFLLEKFIEEGHPLYNGQIYFSSFYKYIPRIFWEGKPYDYGFAVLNYEFFPEFARAGYMPSFGLGSIFADFGFFSIIFLGFMSGFLRNYVYCVFLNSNKNNVAFFLYFYVFDVVMLIMLFFIFLYDNFFKKNKGRC